MFSTGWGLSGRTVCGASHGGMGSGRMRSRTIAMTAPQAQRQTGRMGGPASGAAGWACVNCTRASVRRALWCSTPKFLVRCTCPPATGQPKTALKTSWSAWPRSTSANAQRVRMGVWPWCRPCPAPNACLMCGGKHKPRPRPTPQQSGQRPTAERRPDDAHCEGEHKPQNTMVATCGQRWLWACGVSKVHSHWLGRSGGHKGDWIWVKNPKKCGQNGAQTAQQSFIISVIPGGLRDQSPVRPTHHRHPGGSVQHGSSAATTVLASGLPCWCGR